MNECVAISESLPEGGGQLARACYELSLLHAKQGRANLSLEFKEKAFAVRTKVLDNGAYIDDDSEDAYNNLKLWILW